MKPSVILDPHWRRISELFSPADRARLDARFEVVWGKDGKIPQKILSEALPRATALVAATPVVDRAMLGSAPRLRAVIEVSGGFPDTIDYAACFERGVEVLSSSPGFRESVAEMGLAMILAGARGLCREHEAFRTGREAWIEDRAGVDFTLHGAKVGFVGFGQIAREMTRHLVSFDCQIRAYDPWIAKEVAKDHGVGLCGLDELLAWSRCVVIAAVPTYGNSGLIDSSRLALLRDNTFLLLLSRAHLVNWSDLMAELRVGRITAAIDVFPDEPLPADDPIRDLPNVILSPHRAAAVEGGRRLIGRMLVDDLEAILAGSPLRRLSRADPGKVGSIAGVGDAGKVAEIVGGHGST
ncbi:MAG: hypothetical protein OXF07_01540 [Rhodobacter sp.]|nr:hypothetical protein [Rhodobacter sp.]MCY4241103.1 hypothetical protein [Rhodobacter sp.]